MYTLIAFATQWGSKHGGINSFNADFLTNFGAAYHHSAQIICVITDHTAEVAEKAAKSHVRLIALPYIPQDRSFESSIGELSVDLLQKAGITFEQEKTIWLGHDLITGDAAVAAAKVGGGRSAVIHHMSYDDYESYAEDSESAQKKTEKQNAILRQADLVLAIGPLLRDAASDRLGAAKPINMLVPGLPEIDPKEAPKRFVAFLSGRLSADAARIKQGLLGIAAFASAESLAHEEGGPEALKRQPKLLLRGVDFENRISEASLNAAHDPEADLKHFAEQYSEGVIDLHTLPYTENRQQLYLELSRASVALMPSWHEGFGLVAWEAIAAGVPLIIGENTGVYRLLDEEYFGAQRGYVDPIDVRGQRQFPYFRTEDLDTTVNALKSVATDSAKARKRASRLRNDLIEKYTWAYCTENAAKAFGWKLERGVITDRISEIVQEVDEHSSITLASVKEAGPLRIPHRQWRPRAGMADSHLLRAEEALMPFDSAREPEVKKLIDWADDHTWPTTVRLITGAGGQGKTRLALHLCERLRNAGWYAGFLDSELEGNQMHSSWDELKALDQSVLIIIDYAETRQTVFLSLLKAIFQNPTVKHVRILLLARDGGEWWDNLPGKDPNLEAFLNGYATTGPFRLNALYAEQEDRRRAFTAAINAFAAILEVKPPDIVPDLIGEQFERPLFVQMAALLNLYGERPTTAQGLTRALLNHERRYWEKLLANYNWPDPGRHAEQLLALATLTAGIATSRAAESLWTAAKQTGLKMGDVTVLFRNLATLYPGTEGLQALRPDLLGEALVAQALLRSEGDTLLDAVLGSSVTQSARRKALTVLARMSRDRRDVDEILVTALERQFGNCGVDLIAVSTETLSRLPELAELSFRRLPSPMKRQISGLLIQSLSENSVQLAGLKRLVFEHSAESARERLEKKPNNTDRMAQYADSLTYYAIALHNIGAYAQACQVSEVAIQVFQRVISKSRQAHEAAYSVCISNYSGYLSHVGRDAEALVRGQEALEIQARLAQMNPTRFEPNYANSLNNYSNILSDLGQTEDALKQIQKALEIRQRLAERDPCRFESDYAATLSNYSNRLVNVDKLDEALTQAQKAHAIHKRLAQTNPDRFDPDYAVSLSNYVSRLSDVGKHEDALKYTYESVQINKRLAEKNPDRFDAPYARSLDAAAFIGAGVEPQQASSYAQKALAIYSRLADTVPERFESEYASFLSRYSDHLVREKKYQEALAHSRKAAELYEKLVLRISGRFEAEYTRFLSGYSTLLADTGHFDDAVRQAHISVEIHKRLVEAEPERWERGYASSLNDYSNRLADQGQIQEALVQAREALQISKQFAIRQPDESASSVFVNTCTVTFLEWLCDLEYGTREFLPESLLLSIRSDEQDLMKFYWAFVQACTATAPEKRKRYFRSVLSIWTDLDPAGKQLSDPYYLCALVWSTKFDAERGVDWAIKWHDNVLRRRGNLPVWMIETARHLAFEFPKRT